MCFSLCFFHTMSQCVHLIFILSTYGPSPGRPRTKYKLEKHSQRGLVKDGNHLGGSRGGSSEQIRMASECGPMHPLGCRLSQGQRNVIVKNSCQRQRNMQRLHNNFSRYTNRLYQKIHDNFGNYCDNSTE